MIVALFEVVFFTDNIGVELYSKAPRSTAEPCIRLLLRMSDKFSGTFSFVPASIQVDASASDKLSDSVPPLKGEVDSPILSAEPT